MDQQQRDGLLKEEYFFLQKCYEDFDQRTLLIKGWSVTVSLGGLALGFQSKQQVIWILAGLSAVLFWVLEAKWKSFQYAFSPRIQEIEAYFRGDKKEGGVNPLQIYTAWFHSYQAPEDGTGRNWVRYGLLPFVLIPHVVTLLVAVLLIWLHDVRGPLW